MSKMGGDSSPTFFKIQPISTTGLLDNRLGRVVGGIKISGDVIITWLWRHRFGGNFTQILQKLHFFKAIFRPEERVLAQI